MRKDFEVFVPADVQTLPALPPFDEFEECMFTSPLGYTVMTHRAYCAGPYEICPEASRFQHNQPGWRAIIHTKDGTVLNVSHHHYTKEDAYDSLMDYMKRWMMHRNPNLER
ncbi:MAG: hypothetical protein Q4D27_05095 [Coriobacteriia bacterium]|nr:hypothetical protein [Coriobacteriia bacterium]